MNLGRGSIGFGCFNDIADELRAHHLGGFPAKFFRAGPVAVRVPPTFEAQCIAVRTGVAGPGKQVECRTGGTRGVC